MCSICVFALVACGWSQILSCLFFVHNLSVFPDLIYCRQHNEMLSTKNLRNDFWLTKQIKQKYLE